MSLAVVLSRGLVGLDAPRVTVECHAGNGLPGINVVGLPETEVKEARDRVRAALQNANFDVPPRKFTVNLAPADLPKESGRFDLPIALGILASTGQLPQEPLATHEFAGELALTGELRPIRGVLAMTLAARRDGHAFVLPQASAAEAALVRDARVYPAKTLLDVCAHITGQTGLTRLEPSPPALDQAFASLPDLADVRGQAPAKRVLTIAAAGAHSLLMVGPPGSGKSMLAQRLPGILPPPTEDEALASAAIASLAGRFQPNSWGGRPYRAPHHTASAVALVGGGSDPRPGEISLAHRGVLFLDELPEWDRRVLEVLREPLESGVINISRAARQCTFPAEFQLIAAMNPCPCGWLGHESGRCHCSPDRIARYRERVSGPLLDRIDLRIEVPAVMADALTAPSLRESRARSGTGCGAEAGSGSEAAPSALAGSSAEARAAVLRARDLQLARQGKSNARLDPREVERECRIDEAAATMLAQALSRFALSARAYHRVLKVARTIADLVEAPTIGAPHVAEALAYRRFESR